MRFIRFWRLLILSFLVFGFTLKSRSDSLLTNVASFENPPKWLTMGQVNAAAERPQSYLEWTVHRVQVIWYYNQNEFEKAHGLSPLVMAVYRSKENKILIGPRVDQNNFKGIFGHELVHAIIYQKYKGAIPSWLEEGLANFVSKSKKVDYKKLKKLNLPQDIKKLTHPFASSIDARLFYECSQAMAEMIDKKCDFRNLLRLSVKMKLENYLETYCRIKDINKSFIYWVKKEN